MPRWIHPEVMLVATDLSDLDRLMPLALEQAAQTGARLLLLHVLTASESLAADACGMPYYDPAGAMDFAAKSLEHLCAQARQQNIPCHALVRRGNPAQQIGAVARQFLADRVLLGTRSRSRLNKVLLGSVAEQVLRSVKIPVLTVGPEAHLPVDGSTGERIVLHATTLRETSRLSAALACQIAASLGARLVLLHVLPPLTLSNPEPPTESWGLHYLPLRDLPDLDPDPNHLLPNEIPAQGTRHASQPASFDSATLHELRRLAAETGAGCGVAAEAKVVHGNPSIEILAQAHERGARLIVLGARCGSAFENLTHDRTIYRVLAHARCPVLTLREFEPKPGEKETERLAIHLR
jgi:nucleotide-binding universal stress UspA family protein